MTKIPDEMFQTEVNEKFKPKAEAHVNEKTLNLGLQKTSKNEIAKLIGEGENAKNSIVWIIIRWSLWIPLVITTLYFFNMWIVYAIGDSTNTELKEIRESILKIWSVFSPIITLALGYIYGKGESKEEK